MKTFKPSNNYLYYGIEAFRAGLKTLNFMIKATQDLSNNLQTPLHNTLYNKIFQAQLTLGERLTRQYEKPRFNITECEVDSQIFKIKEKTVLSKTFCNLKHLRKIGCDKVTPKLLIVAPMAGHYPTLLRSTAQESLTFSDVYITDWNNANSVPLEEGRFDMDDFIDYIIEFAKFLGPDLHIMAVCQPTVPVLAATSIMSANDAPYTPKSLTLIGGPIDARKRPTQVDMLAKSKTVEWFHDKVTMPVPPNYVGHGREVYPGFLQLAGFMSLDMARHINEHLELFKSLVTGDTETSERITKFYDEYFAVMDLPSEFYLQTIEEIFKDFALARGKLLSRGREVHLSDIKKCAMLAVEGEKDNIAAVGQTKAVLNLCRNLPDSMKTYHLEPNVGHYGVFSGSKFKKFIVPVIKNFIYSHDTNKALKPYGVNDAKNNIVRTAQDDLVTTVDMPDFTSTQILSNRKNFKKK